IHELPPNLPAESKIAVTISYDASARVTVSARDVTSGREAQTEIHRGENVVVRKVADDEEILTLEPVEDSVVSQAPAARPATAPRSVPTRPPAPPKAAPARDSQSAEIPILLCEKCGGALDARGECSACRQRAAAKAPATQKPAAASPPKPAV